jgi:hypothetical protein
MNTSGWLRCVFTSVLFLLQTLGIYLFQVLHRKTFLDPVVKPFERLTYRISGVNPEKEQGWILYTVAMLIFEVVTTLFTYLILRFQNFLPLNPQGQAGVTDHLAFNTAWSFATNTNWQSYDGESTMSYLSQMLALASHNFFSAAVGIAIASAVVSGIARPATKRSAISGLIWCVLTIICFFRSASYTHVSGYPGVPQNQAIRHGKVVRSDRAGTKKMTLEIQSKIKGNPVMVDQKLIPRASSKGQSHRRWRSRCSGPMVEATLTRTQLTPLRIPRPSQTLFRCSQSLPSLAP